ncbi:MAG: carboxypeptidase-like regulatory domain-containing protein [Planctomycetia bacterium]|nr:carboxypeptidase-like regulatory domain-containing protein [Planctomycetia bacterium]
MNVRRRTGELTQKCNLWIGCVLILLLSGCGVRTVSLSGQVTYNGQPAKDVAVTFDQATGGISASGKTDTEGNFTLRLLNDSKKSGIVPGEYTVRLFWVDPNEKEDAIGPTHPSPYPETLPVYSTEGVPVSIDGTVRNIKIEMTQEYQ